jgi:hypothetical protein
MSGSDIGPRLLCSIVTRRPWWTLGTASLGVRLSAWRGRIAKSKCLNHPMPGSLLYQPADLKERAQAPGEAVRPARRQPVTGKGGGMTHISTTTAAVGTQ